MKNIKPNITLLLLTVLFICNGEFMHAQFAPPAGQPESTAIHADSSIFIDWAIDCEVVRGFINISSPELGLVTYGNELNGIAKADNGVVSLGDGGVAILNFDIPIANGPGWDFAIFENSFSDDFLELAFVEVSSDGVVYQRFNNISLTQENIQVETFGLVDATQINNLAGKYRAYYGVPFDLSELEINKHLDLSNIISIKIIDVVGNVDLGFASYDSEGNIINDPWPTPFESGGFDLDGIGVINNRDNTSAIENTESKTEIIFPVPANNYFSISLNSIVSKILILDLSGVPVMEIDEPNKKYIDIQLLPVGLYIVRLYSGDSFITAKLIKQ